MVAHRSLSGMANLQMVCYWKEFHIVSVMVRGGKVGILDGHILWPEKRHLTPRSLPYYGFCWPVRVAGHNGNTLCHMYISVDEHTTGPNIITNKTLNTHACRIQMCWRAFQQRRVHAAMLIQNMFRESISNPAHTMCRSRLRREFNTLTYALP